MRLTQAGRSLYRRLEPLVLERESHLLAALGPAERKAFLQALAKMEASAAALDDPA
jgi:DNA-binding MarR family transcriptional regulator